jgi:hypothetical chaperone protein
VGEIEIEIGELTVKGYDVGASVTAVVDAYADVDADAPGRLMHSLKGPLATDYRGTHLFGKDYTLEALIAEFLARLRKRIAQQTGRDVVRAVFGRPVHFANASSDQDDEHAQERLHEAAKLAGFNEVAFELEPVGAGLAFAAQHEMDEGAHALVFDLGGGTLDVAMLRADRDGMTVLATGGMGIGGDTFDHITFRQVLLPWFGGDVHWGPQRAPLPAHILNALGDWQDIPALATAETLRFLREAQATSDDPLRLMALEDLIVRGHAYDLYERVEGAKVALSSRRMAVIAYESGAVSVWQPLTRSQFERIIARERRAIAGVVDETLLRAGIAPDQVDVVVRTGGSSSIPCIVDLLGERFGREKIVEQGLFTGVATGLAMRAKRLGLAAHGPLAPPFPHKGRGRRS